MTLSRPAKDGAWRGRLVENAFGACLPNSLQGPEWSASYWRDGTKETDFVVQRGARTWGLEIKSGRAGRLSGMEAFRRRYPHAQTWVIGAEGIPQEDFFTRNPTAFLE